MTAPFRILHCTTALAPGGQTSLLSRTVAHLDPERFESLACATRAASKSDSVDSLDLGCRVLDLGVSSRLNVLGQIWKIRRAARVNRIDLLHAQVFGTEAEVFFAALAARKPIVGTLTTTFDPALQAAGSGIVRRTAFRAGEAAVTIAARASGARFIALSNWVKKSAVTHLRLPEDRIDVVPVGLIPEDYSIDRKRRMAIDRIRRELNLDESSPVLITVARLSRAKAQEDLIRTMREFVKTEPSARLLMVGDGPLRNSLKSLVAHLGLQSHVIFLGDRSDVADLLHVADVFVFTSKYEGLPNAVVEAMAAGTPVVAFDIPALRDVVVHGESGLLVEGRDPASLAAAITSVISDPMTADRFAETGKRIVQDRYDARHVARQIEAIYDRVLSGTGRNERGTRYARTSAS